MDKGHGEEKREGVVDERPADLMRWCVFSITPSSTPVWGIWVGLWNQTSLQRIPKEFGVKEDVYGECTMAQIRMPVATMELKFHWNFTSSVLFYCILK